MRFIDLIKKKRDKLNFDKEEIKFIIKQIVNGNIPDYQISSLLMAIYLNGMNEEEMTDLTYEMAVSGEILDLSSIKGIKVDKHSTGGVGDKVTLVLAPLVASAGVVMAKLSGRGLGHTGGTIDKLEAIPGFKTSLSTEDFINQLKLINVAVAGQTKNLAPADGILYALRDVTATVDSIPLIVSSILSKKIAAGTDVIVLDVKYGSGAFMKTLEDAKELAYNLVKVGKNLNKYVAVVLSDMDQPLGKNIGHTLEVMEAIDTLKGKGPSDLEQICLTLGGILLKGAKVCDSIEDGQKILKDKINNGEALKKFTELVVYQGGDKEVVNNYNIMPQAKEVISINSLETGYIKHLDAFKIGSICKLLGGGREKKEDLIDLAVGVSLECKRGDYVKKGDILGYIYANKLDKIEQCKELFYSSLEYSEQKIESKKLIKEIILP